MKLSALCVIGSLLFASYGLTAQNTVSVKPGSDQVNYIGRTTITPDSAQMYWSGSTVRMNFKGTSVKALLRDERSNNYLNVIIDGRIKKIKLEAGKKLYTLAENLKNEPHTVALYKITEYDRGAVTFYGFEVNKKARTFNPPPAAKRKIEVYGNSITCGYAVEDSIHDSPASEFENNYLSYAAITARHYNADYSFIAKSGIGITISWFPFVMPDIYDRLNPNDPDSHWDFSQYTPDIVIINLFQNDSWLVKNVKHEQFVRLFGDTPPTKEFIVAAYRKFYESVRVRYPNAHIICALGSMDATREGSPWPDYIKEAVSKDGHKKTYTHFFPYKNTPGHPTKMEQRAMAESLIQFIDANIDW